ncbi:MAG TPA: four helix bundle protein [Fimbriimonas sp.]|nr:four helix bundle protein [Fimbriimonas sp.]
MPYRPIEESKLFSDAAKVADSVAAIVREWPPFDKQTVGLQLVRALDSIAANLVEGDSRFSNRESLRFFDISRASSREATYWLNRAHARKILNSADFEMFVAQVEEVRMQLSGLITYRRQVLGVKEETPAYDEKSEI